MELSDETFSEIAGVAVIDPVYEFKHERRAHPRVGFGGRARIAPLFDTMSHRGVTVMVRDISKGGIGFLSPQRLESGDEFVICLRNKSDKLIKIHSIVCRCDPGGVGLTQFDIGATFELVLETNAMPEEAAGPAEVSASPAPLPEFSTADLVRSGGPIRRFLIRPVTRSAGGIWAFICTCRNNYRVRRRLKADARNRKLHEETKPTGNPSPVPHLQNPTETDSLFTPPGDRTFVPRPGGLFKVDSSSTPPAPVVPEPTVEVSKETPVAPATEASSQATLPAEMPTIIEPVKANVVQEIPQEIVEQESTAAVVEPAPCQAEKMQLEFSWQAQTVAHAAPVIHELQPVEISEVATPEISPAAVSTTAVAPAADPAPHYRTHADVVAHLKKRQASWTRHPRRYRQT